MHGIRTSGTPLFSTMRAAGTSWYRLNSLVSCQCKACPPSQTTTIRSMMRGSIRIADATFVIAPIAST